jgi:hypothetical protein
MAMNKQEGAMKIPARRMKKPARAMKKPARATKKPAAPAIDNLAIAFGSAVAAVSRLQEEDLRFYARLSATFSETTLAIDAWEQEAASARTTLASTALEREAAASDGMARVTRARPSLRRGFCVDF